MVLERIGWIAATAPTSATSRHSHSDRSHGVLNRSFDLVLVCGVGERSWLLVCGDPLLNASCGTDLRRVGQHHDGVDTKVEI